MPATPLYTPKGKDKNLKTYINKIKRVLVIIFLFSMCFNMLMLITPLYSLQVLNRVIGSGNTDTLLMLSLIIAITYFAAYLIQIARSFSLIKVADWLDSNISPMLFNKVIITSSIVKSVHSAQVMQDFKILKTFLSSSAINAIFDAPWTIPYLIVLYLIHPYMFLVALIGALITVIFAFFNVFATRSLLRESSRYLRSSINTMEMSSRNAQTIEAMGMLSNLRELWYVDNRKALEYQCISSYRNGVISNISNFVRSVIQMCVTGFGAYVVITTGKMTTGGMIASSILVGKALGPFNNFIGLWQNTNDAVRAYKSLSHILDKPELRHENMPINMERGYLSAEKIFFSYPTAESNKTVLQDVSFTIEPGEILVLIGDSASGKSTIAKLVTGIWKLNYGTIRVDGHDVYQWHRHTFGQSVGYLPQEIELFHGTIAQNIARMKRTFDPDMVIEAARNAGIHEMISRLPNGYDTDIGIGGSNLSGGQKQRVGLARAFFGSPKILVLDEPNANLDDTGEKILKECLLAAKDRNMSILLISHRPAVLSIADKILVLKSGSVLSYGAANEVLGKKL
jgi:PrtD family type I secretion system ABC transporter